MKKKSKESKKRRRVFRNSRRHKGNDLMNDGKSMYGDEDKSFQKTGAFRNEPVKSQNKVYHLSTAALQRYAFFRHIVFFIDEKF